MELCFMEPVRKCRLFFCECMGVVLNRYAIY